MQQRQQRPSSDLVDQVEIVLSRLPPPVQQDRAIARHVGEILQAYPMPQAKGILDQLQQEAWNLYLTTDSSTTSYTDSSTTTNNYYYTVNFNVTDSYNTSSYENCWNDYSDNSDHSDNSDNSDNSTHTSNTDYWMNPRWFFACLVMAIAMTALMSGPPSRVDLYVPAQGQGVRP